jgi:hypothetical protein
LYKFLNKQYRPYVPPPPRKKKPVPVQLPLGAILPDNRNLVKRNNT